MVKSGTNLGEALPCKQGKVYKNINYKIFLPKLIPHNPVKTVKRLTQNKSPWIVKLNMAKENKRTKIVWPHITTNWVITCENNTSVPVMPETNDRSNIPSLRSINIAPDVNATDKKNMIVRITPGAAKSVKLGMRSP